MTETDKTIDDNPGVRGATPDPGGDNPGVRGNTPDPNGNDLGVRGDASDPDGNDLGVRGATPDPGGDSRGVRGDTSGAGGDSRGLGGDASGTGGDVRGLRGDAPGAGSDVRGPRGDAPDVGGDVRGLRGDTLGASGSARSVTTDRPRAAEETELPELLRRVHMVGIGGAGMSGIARILLARGGAVSGSDAKESRGVLALRARGAAVRIGHDANALDLLPGGPTAVVTTYAAIPKTNPELVEANRRGVPVLLRPTVLADLMRGHHTLLVSGTHGKTSTTSMLVVSLQHCGFDPSFAVGGELNEAGTNAHHGTGGIFVAEADESDGSLLQYEPDVAVVTNIESDHLDYFGTLEAYVQVFDDFVARLRPGGLLVVCLDDPGARALAERVTARDDLDIRVLGYGSGELADAPVPVGVRLLNWEPRDVGGLATVRLADESAPRTLRLSVPGRHMALNALGALLAARDAGAELAEVLQGLQGFGGVHRRFQFVGRENGVRVFDDYAHHPTEVRAVLGAAAELVRQEAADGARSRPGRVIVVFQPHLYSRTATFAADFGAALDLADEVVVLDVYGAREEPLPGVSGALVAQSVTRPVHYQPDMSRVGRQVANLARPGDVVITMGAGDVTMLGSQILDGLRVRPSGR